MRAAFTGVWCLVAASVAFGQAAQPASASAAKAEFEVASVKQSQEGTPYQIKAGLRMDGSQAHFTSLSLKNLITIAYRVQAGEVTGPDWISQQRFDIDAKLPEGATTAQVPEMLQSLLEQRFQLKLRHETKEEPAYALEMGRAPLTLKLVPPDASPAPDASAADGASAAAGTSVSAQGGINGVSIDLGGGTSYTFANNQFAFKRFSMDRAATELARYLDRPVVNMTGLEGEYDFTLPVTQDDYRLLLLRSGVNAGVSVPPQALAYLDANSPTSLFDAMDKAGLHLEGRKLPLDLIVVDSALQAPTQN